MKYCIVGSSYVTDGETQVVLILRDENSNRVIWKIPFSPYFYLKESFYDEFKEKYPGLFSQYVVNATHGFIGVDGTNLVKVETTYPRDVGSLNGHLKEFKVMYESNILFHYRYLVDHNLVTGVDDDLNPIDVEPWHKILFIDIEVLSDKEPRDVDYPIITIGMYDASKKKYISLYIGKDIFPDTSIITSEPRDVILVPCEDEEELIQQFSQLWLKIEPDVIVSFSPFDMTYLIDRMKEIGIDPNFLSPVYQVKERGENYVVGGIHIIDFAELYRKVFGEPVWNTLDFISRKEIGYGKIEIPSVVEIFRTDIKKLLEYNLRDVQLLKDLEDQLSLLHSYVFAIWKVTGLDLSDCLRANRIGDICHLRYLKGKYIFKNESTAFGHPYSGALVLSEKTGLFHNIVVLDWQELYPTIMETFHMSIDTFDKYGGIRIDSEIGFARDHIGWTNEIMKPLRAYRMQIKNESKIAKDKEKHRLKMLSAGLKSVINSLYGLYGQKTKTFTSRFYDPRIAGSITKIGREILLNAREHIASIGYQLLYADTDSLFIQLKENSEEEIKFLKESIQNFVKKYVVDRYQIESSFSLDYEHTFKTVLLLTKKRYHGITTVGEIITKGINLVRKDVAKITVLEQQKVGDMRFSGVPLNEVRDYVMSRYNDVKYGRVSLDDLAVMGRCTQEEYQTLNRNWKALVCAEELGIPVDGETRFYWLYIIPTRKIVMKIKGKMRRIPADVVAFQDLKDLHNVIIDYRRMADYTIKSPLKRYIEPEIVKQPTLSRFFA